MDELRQYRAIVREHWLKHVGRKTLTKWEYHLIDEWIAQQVPVRYVVWAIERTVKRVPVVYSLGIIRSELIGVMKEQARMRVGG